MLISQADPGFDDSTGVGAPTRKPQTLVEDDGQPDGFDDFLIELRKQTIAFGKPVAYVRGDSHYFRIGKPLLDTKGLRIENFTRVETFGDHQEQGSNDVNWLDVLVEPRRVRLPTANRPRQLHGLTQGTRRRPHPPPASGRPACAARPYVTTS